MDTFWRSHWVHVAALVVACAVTGLLVRSYYVGKNPAPANTEEVANKLEDLAKTVTDLGGRLQKLETRKSPTEQQETDKAQEAERARKNGAALVRRGAIEDAIGVADGVRAGLKQGLEKMRIPDQDVRQFQHDAAKTAAQGSLAETTSQSEFFRSEGKPAPEK